MITFNIAYVVSPSYEEGEWRIERIEPRSDGEFYVTVKNKVADITVISKTKDKRFKFPYPFWNAVFTAIDENTVGIEPFSTEVGIEFTEEDEPDPDTGYYRDTTQLNLGLHITEHPSDKCKLRIELNVAKDGVWWNVLDGIDYVDVPKPDNPFEPLSCDYFYVGNIVCVDDNVPLVEAS